MLVAGAVGSCYRRRNLVVLAEAYTLHTAVAADFHNLHRVAEAGASRIRHTGRAGDLAGILQKADKGICWGAEGNHSPAGAEATQEAQVGVPRMIAVDFRACSRRTMHCAANHIVGSMHTVVRACRSWEADWTWKGRRK